MRDKPPLHPLDQTPRRIAIKVIAVLVGALIGTVLVAIGIGGDGYRREPLPAELRPLVVAGCLLLFGAVVLWRVLLRR